MQNINLPSSGNGAEPAQPAAIAKNDLGQDVEKASPNLSPVTSDKEQRDASLSYSAGGTPAGSDSRMNRLAISFRRYMKALNLEERGIRRVEPEERHSTKSLGYAQITLLWFGINLVANNITLGILGPAVFELSFLDASLCAVFGMLVGCLPVAYIATFGPRSGTRALVFARYVMGWYPGKIIVILNMIGMLGYCLLDAIIAGQILAAVSPHNSLSIAVGIIITVIVTLLLTTVGYRALHYYERYTWIPQLIVLSILAGVAGPSFDLYAPTQGDTKTRVASRLSFFGLCLSAAITYAGPAADYFVYYPESTPRLKVFFTTLLGLTTSFTYTFILGIGLASAIPTNAAYSTAYNTSQGALIATGFSRVGRFGDFCAVLVALGLVANMVPPTYSSGVDFQILGRIFARVPRVIWNTVGVVIYTVCALVGRDHLAEIFTNFLALMGYWVSIWIAITLEEHLLFRRRWGGRYILGRGSEFDWTSWNKRADLPIGVAALVAFLVGWAGAVLSMAQVWYVGPIAGLVGVAGADMGNYVGFMWAAVVFPGLRWWELGRFGR